MKVSVQYAEDHFADILNAASSGEVVEIALPDRPALLPAPTPGPAEQHAFCCSRREHLYAGEGLVTVPSDDEWRAMDKETEDEMLNGPIFPPETA